MDLKELLNKGFWVLLARVLGAGLMFFLTLFFARWLGVESFGLFSLALTIMTVLGVLARWGTDQVLLKQVSSHWVEAPADAIGYARASLWLVLMLSLLLALFIVMFNGWVSQVVFGKPLLADVLLIFGLLIVPLSISLTLSEVYKGAGRPILAAYLQNVLPAFGALSLGGVLWYLGLFDLVMSAWAYAFGIFLSLVGVVLAWARIMPKVEASRVQLVRIIKEGWPMLLVTSGGLIMAWSDMIVLGVFGSESDLGVYSVASRVVLVTSLVLIAMNSITAPRYAALYKENDLENLKLLAQNSSNILLFVVLVPSLVLWFFPEWVLNWFGADYVMGWGILMILAVGQFINVSCGSVGYLLTMTGKEHTMRNIMLWTAFFNVVLSVVLVQVYGAIGVAYATALSMILWNIWAMFEVKRHLGFWTFSPLVIFKFKSYR